jgi:vancomycin resistance protein YoaR
MKRWLVPLLFCLIATTSVAAERPNPITLIFDDRSITLDFQLQPELLQQTPIHFLRVGEMRIPLNLEGELPPAEELFDIETEFVTRISPENLQATLSEMSIVRAPKQSSVTISLDDEETIHFEGTPHDGYEINVDRLTSLLDTAIIEGKSDVRVPARKLFSSVTIADELQDRGIREIVAIGESNFSGSSNARKINVKAGAAKFNGSIIKQGGIFSFNDILQDVDAESGFVEELVIKGNETLKEQGGGVCQVSTTAFRAALTGGLPITIRRSHSYAVPYYKPYGLDATIYLGAQDFRFKNDTQGDLLIQTFTEDDNLFFVFYGTDDGRNVQLEGPFISDFKKAPTPIVYATEDLPEGETTLISPQHNGFRTEWWRYISHDGTTLRDEFVSEYRAWPAKILKGTKKVLAEG